MMCFRKILTTALLLGAFFSSSFAFTTVGANYILSTEWEVSMDPIAGGQAVLTQIHFINITPEGPSGLLLDVYVIFFDNMERPLFYGVIHGLSPRDFASIDVYMQLGLPMGRGTVAILPLPAGVTPDEMGTPLTDVLDGYLVTKTYSVVGGLTMTASSKTGFLGTGGTSHGQDFTEFKGRTWVPLPNN